MSLDLDAPTAIEIECLTQLGARGCSSDPSAFHGALPLRNAARASLALVKFIMSEREPSGRTSRYMFG
jgi:hypothetical protein